MNETQLSSQNLNNLVNRFRPRRALTFGAILIAALVAFEFFNFSTTEFALTDLIGDLGFAGIRWSLILAVAFCGIDFAGIARLFTPEQGFSEATEVWYLFGAWLLAATMNAMLTWWGVSIAILGHESLGNAVVARETLVRVVPIFVAIMVWLIRVLIIGSFSIAGNQLFSQPEARRGRHSRTAARQVPVVSRRSNPLTEVMQSASPTHQRGSVVAASRQPSQKPAAQPGSPYSRPEPTYHPESMSAQGNAHRYTHR
jgi:hypothetical protein